MMKRILEELNDKIGARGSLVITRDGIPIASTTRAEFDTERVAALTQKTLAACGALVRRLGQEHIDRFYLTADSGRMIFVELESAYLVVITRISADGEQVMLEVDSAARRIERATRITV